MTSADKVDQTLFGDGKGNCWPACIATITGIPLAEMPNFCVDHNGDGWYVECIKWLRSYGFAMWNTVTKGDTLEWVNFLIPEIPWIATGPNAQGVMHCCVYIGTKLWHDPNPNSRNAGTPGLLEVQDATFFLKTQYR